MNNISTHTILTVLFIYRVGSFGANEAHLPWVQRTTTTSSATAPATTSTQTVVSTPTRLWCWQVFLLFLIIIFVVSSGAAPFCGRRSPVFSRSARGLLQVRLLAHFPRGRRRAADRQTLIILTLNHFLPSFLHDIVSPGIFLVTCMLFLIYFKY